jgi:hypothetical protein
MTLDIKKTVRASLLAAVLVGTTLVANPSAAAAKGGGGKRPRFIGLVQSRPTGKTGTWVIGGRKFRAIAGTQLDQAEGTLRNGVCAKVTVRAGSNIAIEIDSEPASDC